MSGRAPLGGRREVALACLLVGRLVLDATASSGGLSLEQRRARASGAKHWLGAAALPASVRAALTRLAEATATDDRRATKVFLDGVMSVTASHLDPAARLELARLAQAIAE